MPAASRTVRSILVLFLVLVLTIPAALPAASPPAIGSPDPAVLDERLVEVMGTSDPMERLDIIVQFWDEVERSDRQLLEDLGITTIGEYRIIPAVHAQGTPLQIERLSGSPRVKWVEYDLPMELLMDETTQVINATASWRSIIEGSLWGGEGIDGKGVTAVVLDTGIDAGHPDLDYGTKTIRNLKSDTGTGPWYEIENGDTSSGHGTHCAGTVAGNGDASAGSRAGVAPKANLIGLSTGEAGAITGATGALQWVYEHSRPGNNPYNIRVVSNSWGAGGGIYQAGDAISEAINRLTYENNVVCVFAAGNSDGDGNTIQSGNYANTPAAICVAATGRDGTYITSFSSKGKWDWIDTYPDIGAPGHYIESTAARRTQISAMTQSADSNPYYLAISGTSMATPHISGVVALLWQAAPSMRVSDERQDAGVVVMEGNTYTVVPPEEVTSELADRTDIEDYNMWMERPDTRIHEAEIIIKLTSDMIPPEGSPDPAANNLTENWVPDWQVPGFVADRPHDWAQGYGLVNVHRAIGLALTLEKLRWENPEATVYDAFEVYHGIFEEKEVVVETDRIKASWSGEWSRFNDQPTNPGVLFSANQTRFVYVPDGAESMTVSLTWPPLDATIVVAGTLGFKIDFDNNGGWDYESSIAPAYDGTRTETVSISGSGGQYWRFGIEGHGIKWHRLIERKQFQEARMEYEMSVSIKFPQGYGTIEIPPLDPHAIVADLKFAQPSEEYTVGNISMVKHVFNLNNITWSPEVEPPVVPETGGFSIWWFLLTLVILLIFMYLVAKLMPESTTGKAIRKAANATGATTILDQAKRVPRKTLRLVRPTGRKAKPEKAEPVTEEQAASDT
jgi:subtilisin family serine protease